MAVRWWAVMLGTLGVTSMGAGIAWWVVAGPLPHPDHADRQELLRWLVVRDLSAEPRDLQESLADRLQEEFAVPGGVSNADSVPNRYRDQFRSNLLLVQKVWFEARVARYARCGADERMKFLEAQIEAVAAWSAAASRVAAVSGSAGSVPVDFFSQIDGWVEAADEIRRPLMNVALRDAVVCWLSTRDAGELSVEAQTHLANRIAQSLENGTRAGDVPLALDDTHRHRIAENGQVLMQAWMLEQAAAFADLPPEERSKFVDERIADVVEWNIVPLVTYDGTNHSASPLATGLRLLKLVDQWTASAPEPQRAAMQELGTEVKKRMLMRRL